MGRWIKRLRGELDKTWEFAQREREYPPLGCVFLSGLPCGWENFERVFQDVLECDVQLLADAWPRLRLEPSPDRVVTVTARDVVRFVRA